SVIVLGQFLTFATSSKSLKLIKESEEVDDDKEEDDEDDYEKDDTVDISLEKELQTVLPCTRTCNRPKRKPRLIIHALHDFSLEFGCVTRHSYKESKF
ncbi:hypothetical protein H0E87_006122, partial [Populus deltoides]